MNSALLNEATKLSIPERIELVEAIWDSVAAGINALPLSEDHRLELDGSLGARLLNEGYAGIRTDFMDVRFDNYQASPDA